MNQVFSCTWADNRIENFEKFYNDNCEHNFMFILDTNFCIYAREYVYNYEEFKKSNSKLITIFIETVDFLKKSGDPIICHYGCEEASRNKATNKIDVQKYIKMIGALSILLERKFSSELVSGESDAPFDIKVENMYVALLKAFLLKKTKPNLSKQELLREYVYFLKDELDSISPTLISFGFHYFGGESNVLKKTIISKGFEIVTDKIHAAAIDLSLPTVCGQLAEISKFGRIPVFVSFDKGIKLIFDSLVIKKKEIINGELMLAYEYIADCRKNGC